MEARRFTDPLDALGRAVNLLRWHQPFKEYRFGPFVAGLMGQIRREHYMFTAHQGSIVGYVGWAFCVSETAWAWVEDRYSPTYEECLEGPAGVIVTFLAASPDVVRFQTRICRPQFAGRHVFFRRDYGTRIRAGRVFVRSATSAVAGW